MELTAKKNGTELLIALDGELNTLTAPKLKDLLARELPGMQSLTLGFFRL